MWVQATPLVILLGLVAVLATGVSYAIWQNRPRAGATWLAIGTFGVALWSIGGVLVVGSTDQPIRLIGGYLAMVTTTANAVCWVHFSARYTGRDEWLTRRRSVLLWVVLPVLLAAGSITARPLLSLSGPRVGSLLLSPGFGFFVFIGYGYTLMGVGIALLLGKLQHSRNVYRRRTFLFVLIGVTMLFGHLASVVGISPAPHTTLGPLLFVGIGLLSALVHHDDTFLRLLPIERVYGVFGRRFEDLGPIARDAVIEEMGSGVVVLDADNRIVDLNPRARQMMAMGENRIVGDQIDSILDADAFEADVIPFLDADVREGRFDGVWVQTPEGRQRCYDVVLSNLGARRDGVNGRVAIIHDVTEKQRQQQQLEAQTRKLKRQNENLEAFATIVSHDLRNPLTVATGHVEYALETGETDHLDTALKAHDRMASIISDVLRLARQGRTVDETDQIPIAETAEAAWETIETEHAELDLRLDGESVEADESRLQQVFENLFENSIEHAVAVRAQADPATDGGADEPGTVPDGVTVWVGPTADGFYVADDGPGIPEDERESVFVEGFTTDEGGTGLGLAIVSMIVDAHGWDVELTASEEGGARFEIVTE